MSQPAPTSARRALRQWAGGAALLVLAARFAEIARYAGDTPFNDQWKIEALDVLLPWFDGTLRLADFFAPHFEHVPVWTRLLVWLQVGLTGRWDPLVQMTVNALAHAAFAGLVVHFAAQILPRGAALLATALVVALGAFPHAWENITWGFQSQFPLALLALWLHAHGSFRHAPGSAGWWRAQLAGVAGLFTLGSMALAPLAVVLTSVWTRPRHAREVLVPGVIAAAGLALGLALRSGTHADMLAHGSTSALSFFHAALDLLGWPTARAGGVVLMQFPLLVFAWQLRGRADASAGDRTILALGGWAIGQALALAFARGGDYGGYVSRYGDLLAVSVIANALALLRLLPDTGRRRWTGWAAAGIWSSVVVLGMHTLSTTGHTRYYHDHAAQWIEARRATVQNYLQTGDRAALATPEARSVLFGAPEIVARVLDHPRLRAALPAAVNPANEPGVGNTLARTLQRGWWAWAALGTLLLGLGVWRIGRGPESSRLGWRDDPLQAGAFAALGAVTAAALWLWPAPLVFDVTQRWEALLNPPGVVREVSFDFVGPAPLSRDRLWGAAAISPPEYRNWFAGSRPDYSVGTATIQSGPFALTAPWLIIPVAGFPSSAGNTLQLEVLDQRGDMVHRINYDAANPRDVTFWNIDVTAHQNRSARLRIEDGRAETEDWVAVGPPILAPDPRVAARLERWLRLERFAATHRSLGWIAGASFVVALVLGWRAWRRRGAA